MVRCSTPDTLIGLGEGGSRVVYRFMEQQWILNEVLGNGRGNADQRPGTLRATTIDTATGETWHEDRAGAVKATVQAAIENSEHVAGDRFLEFQGPTIIPDKLPTGLKNKLHPASKSIVNLLADGRLNSWWLEEGCEPLNQLDDRGFDDGLNGFRAMSKALFHITQQKSANCDLVAVPPEGEVCIVTSLGGGTGSGLAIDLATSLNDEHYNINNIHLYGILPHTGEDTVSNANAYAALSELEYAELAGESPFDTITLIPHLEAVEDKNAEFEMAAVRTILARQNGKSVDRLRPRRMSATYAPAYAPFTIASPVTLQFDFATKEEALEVVVETLKEKSQELEAENTLYDVVEQYLKESFPNTAGAELAGVGSDRRVDFDGHDRRLGELQRRIEGDLWGEFLGSDALAVVDFEGTVDRIEEAFKVVCDDDSLGIAGFADERERTARFVELVPERLIERLEAEIEPELTDGDPIAYELVKTVQDELENVARRRNLYQAISRITAKEVPELSEGIAETIRTALVEVILDEETRYLASEITSPRLREMIEYQERELTRHEDVLTALGKQYETVAAEIERMRAAWYDSVQKEAELLAAINRNEQAIPDAVYDLSDRIERACYEVNRAETEAELNRIELNLDQTSPLGNQDKSFDGIVPLNEMLDTMELEPIPVDEVKGGFKSIKRARQLELTHGGILPWRDNSEEFETAVREAEESSWFSINPGEPDVSIEDRFVCSFRSEKFDLSVEIDVVREDVIDAIAETFAAVFTEDGETFVSYEAESEHWIDIPQGGSPRTVQATLTSALAASSETDPDDILHDVMPVSEIDLSDPSQEPLSGWSPNGDALKLIVDAYLQPIIQQYEAAKERYDVLVDDKHAPGLVSRMKTLRAIAEGTERVDAPDPSYPVSVGVPNLADRDFNSMSGYEFAEKYEGIYGFDLDDLFKYEGNQNPYVVPMVTDLADFAGDPADIAETQILEKRSDDIEKWFHRKTSDLIWSDKRAPYELSIRGNATKTATTDYKQHRIRQVYLSRAFEGMYKIGKQYDEVYGEYDNILSLEGEMYDAETHPHGWTDDVTMVTFVGGIFLDNISLVSEPGGYRDAYQNSYDQVGSPGSHHTIGLGAMWDRWSLLGEWVTDAWEEANPDTDADFGGFVYRNEVYDPSNNSFVEEIKYRNKTDDESAADLFLDALTANAYESTVGIGKEQTNDESDSQF